MTSDRGKLIAFKVNDDPTPIRAACRKRKWMDETIEHRTYVAALPDTRDEFCVPAA